MNELKPEDVMRALEHMYFPNEVALTFRDDIRGEKFDVTFADISALLREKDAKIAELQSIAEHPQSSNMKRWFELQEKDKQLAEKDAKIADYIRQIADMQAEIATKDRELTALMKHKQIEAEKDAEIERLKTEVKFGDIAYQDLKDLYDADVNHLSDHITALIDKMENARAEAITEFAERLKDRSMTKWDYHEAVDVDEIERVAKEMREGNSGNL